MVTIAKALIIGCVILTFVSLPAYSPGFDPNIMCLADNVYHEARGESVTAQEAVAWVTLNRAKVKNRVCSEVYRKHAFSWTAHKSSYTKAKDFKAYKTAFSAAYRAYHGTVADPTKGATFYHSVRVSPWWAKKMTRIAIIDSHIFYTA